jgi:hypothetical protein
VFIRLVGAHDGRSVLVALTEHLEEKVGARSNSAKAPVTDSIRLAIGESSPLKTRCSLRNSIRTPRLVMAKHAGC